MNNPFCFNSDITLYYNIRINTKKKSEKIIVLILPKIEGLANVSLPGLDFVFMTLNIIHIYVQFILYIYMNIIIRIIYIYS